MRLASLSKVVTHRGKVKLRAEPLTLFTNPVPQMATPLATTEVAWIDEAVAVEVEIADTEEILSGPGVGVVA